MIPGWKRTPDAPGRWFAECDDGRVEGFLLLGNAVGFRLPEAWGAHRRFYGPIPAPEASAWEAPTVGDSQSQSRSP